MFQETAPTLWLSGWWNHTERLRICLNIRWTSITCTRRHAWRLKTQTVDSNTSGADWSLPASTLCLEWSSSSEHALCCTASSYATTLTCQPPPAIPSRGTQLYDNAVTKRDRISDMLPLVRSWAYSFHIFTFITFISISWVTCVGLSDGLQHL